MKSNSAIAPVFYCPVLAELNERGTLSVQESRHATASRRLRVGDAIDLFDGAGAIAHADIEHINNKWQLEFSIRELNYFEAPAHRLWLASAIPKGDRQSVLLDMVTQLGVTDILPVKFQHSVWRQRETPERWQRIVLEASKQSRRPWLPDLHQPIDLNALIETMSTVDNVLLAHQHGASVRAHGLNSDSLAIVGPEGGLSDDELSQLTSHGAKPIAVTANVLRIETAAVAIVSALSS